MTISSTNPSTKHRFRAPWIIFWVGLALRIACILIGHTYRVRLNDNHFDFGFEAGRIAQSLVEGRGYANPFNGISGPTAWLPPLYPLLMAVAFKLFGVYSRGAAFFLLACNSVFSAAIAPAIYEIAARCFDAQGIARRGSKHDAPVALWSAWLWAAYPAALQYAIHWIWEMSLSTCLLTWTLVVALRLRRVGEEEPLADARRDLRLWLSFGLLWGLVMLSNASVMLVLPGTIVWILWPRQGLRRGIAGAALACVVMGIVMAPWVIRNERTMHAFIPTRDNLGVELWQSSLFYHEAFPWGTAMPLWPGDPEFRKYVRMGEFAYAQQKGTEAKRNLRARPDLFLKYTLMRLQFFWFGTPHPTEGRPLNEFFRILNYSFLSVAGLLGMGLALKRRVPAACLMASVFLLVPVAYYVVTVQARFRHPIEPLIAILSVYLFRSTTLRRATLGSL
ncbi:MAG TPA: hypothetical protein VFC39_15855 [Acidobacteriaceae bacterium]|nr:hypothetical protein [Acidobacteriaceae bacterium]